MFTVGAHFTVGWAVFTVGAVLTVGAHFTVGVAVFTVGGAAFTVRGDPDYLPSGH